MRLWLITIQRIEKLWRWFPESCKTSSKRGDKTRRYSTVAFQLLAIQVSYGAVWRVGRIIQQQPVSTRYLCLKTDHPAKGRNAVLAKNWCKFYIGLTGNSHCWNIEIWFEFLFKIENSNENQFKMFGVLFRIIHGKSCPHEIGHLIYNLRHERKIYFESDDISSDHDQCWLELLSHTILTRSS